MTKGPATGRMGDRIRDNEQSHADMRKTKWTAERKQALKLSKAESAAKPMQLGATLNEATMPQLSRALEHRTQNVVCRLQMRGAMDLLMPQALPMPRSQGYYSNLANQILEKMAQSRVDPKETIMNGKVPTVRTSVQC